MRLFIRQNPAAPLAGYIQEILAVEGFLRCETLDVTGRRLDQELLDGQELVIVAHMPLDTAEREVLEDYVRHGGRLIALRPPVEMAPLFGLEARNPVLKRGHYLQFDAAHCPAGARSTETPLQVHAEADCYAVKGAEVAAWFCWSSGGRRPLPAAVLSAAGQGMAAMLPFDLAHSTVLHHQGLPEQASTGSCPDPGALGQYKPDGHFVGLLDPTRATIPQADLQQRLLGALVDRMLPTPLPRLWYFPDAEPCLAFLNGDSDSMNQDDLDAVLSVIEPRGGRYTCYVMDEEPLTPAAEAAIRGRGNSFGKHIWAGGLPSLETMAAAVEEQVAGYRRWYGYTPLSNRGHCLIWPGWTEMAQFLAAAGVRMDSNFVGAHCGHGYLTGSGLPVKFMDESGRMIDLYEQSTQWEDDVALGEYFERLSYEQAICSSLETLREARERYHTVVNFNFHPIHIRQEHLNTREWITAVADYCREQRLPMISGDAWARFNDARRRVRMAGYSADAARRRVRFNLTAADAIAGLTISIPTTWDGAAIQGATAGGDPLPLRRWRLHNAERAFLWLTMEEGETQSLEVAYSGPGDGWGSSPTPPTPPSLIRHLRHPEPGKV
jgi:hypothetical protein